MKLRNPINAGFTLVEIMIVVAIIGLLAAIALPNFVKARTKAQTNLCINNQRLLESAKTQWALELKKTDSDTVDSSDLLPYLRSGTAMPQCPTAGTYIITTVGETITCSIANHTL